MNAKQFFIAHGEKVAVSVTLLACAAQLAVTFGDLEIRPTITPTEIEASNGKIEQVFVQGKAPTMRPVPGYLNDMKSRFDRVIPVPTVPSWLTALPDRGSDGGGLQVYIAELRAPTMTGSDATGNAALTLTFPAPVRPGSRRITDAESTSWSRTDGTENHVTQVGVLIETHTGDGVWKPLVTKAIPQGFVAKSALSFVDGSASLVVDGLEPWVRYWFRARILAKATGLEFGKPLTTKTANSVIVVPGALPTESESVPWAEIGDQLKNNDETLLSKLARPLPSPPTGLSLNANEQVYAGAVSDEIVVTTTSDTRFALDRITQDDPNNPNKLSAKLLITKQLTDKTGQKTWLKEPQAFKLAVGDMVGGSTQVIIDGNKRNLTLAAPFKIVEIKTGEKRILYWEIKEKSRAAGKGKDLDCVAKEMPTDLVIVENTKSKRRLTLAKLSSWKTPKRANLVVFPHTAGDVDEIGDFRKDPLGFVQADLQPVKPIAHEPDAGPLTALRATHKDAADLYTTDTTYFELSDGRLVWWDPLNKRIRQDPEPSTKVDSALTPADPVAPEGSPEVKPAVDKTTGGSDTPLQARP